MNTRNPQNEYKLRYRKINVYSHKVFMFNEDKTSSELLGHLPFTHWRRFKYYLKQQQRFTIISLHTLNISVWLQYKLLNSTDIVRLIPEQIVNTL
jgi:hypothetical protein